MIAALLPLALKYWRGLAIAGGVLAGVGAYYAWRAHERDLGAAIIKHQIEEQNRANDQKADAAQRGPDECFAAGRDWDRARGVCLPVGGGK